MPPSQDQDTAIAIEALRQQMGQVVGTLEEIKGTLAQIVQLDRSVAELVIHTDTQRRDITLLWERNDEGRARDEALRDSISVLKSDHDKFVNTFQGGMRVFLAVVGLFQTATIGAVVWVFSHVNSTDVMQRLHDQRISAIEQANRDAAKERNR